MKRSPNRAGIAVALAAALLPITSHAGIFGIYETGNTVVGLSDAAMGVCKNGWRTAYFMSYGKIPSCWGRTKDGYIAVCPAQKGQPFRAQGCSYISASYFVDPTSMVQAAKFPQ